MSVLFAATILEQSSVPSSELATEYEVSEYASQVVYRSTLMCKFTSKDLLCRNAVSFVLPSQINIIMENSYN